MSFLMIQLIKKKNTKRDDQIAVYRYT